MSHVDPDFLKTLERMIRDYLRQIENLKEQRRSIDDEISQMEECLDNAIGLLEAEQKRLGEARGAFQARLPMGQRFARMFARDAIHTVLRENKRMDKDDIAEALRDGGFDFGDKSPIRVVHFAVVGDPHVKLHPSGICEWVEEGVEKT